MTTHTISLTLSDTQTKQIIRLQKIINCPSFEWDRRQLSLRSFEHLIDTEEITKEQIISSMLDEGIEAIGGKELAYEPTLDTYYPFNLN